RAAPGSPESSRAATSRTTSIVRPSPPRGRAAWPPSTPSVTSNRSTRSGKPTAQGRVHPAAHPEDAKGNVVGDAITNLTDATFDESVGSAAVPVIVDFWAEWCGPCKMIAPVLEEIAKDHEGKLQVAKLNVDDNPDIARRFDVMSIPTLLV